VHPELLHWGFLHIRSYGVMLAVAFLVGTTIALREARRLRLDEDKVVSVILLALVAGVLGARGLYVIEHVEEFRQEWGSALALWQGGLTLYGGIVAGTFVGLLAARRLGLSMWLVADALTPSLALGTAFGRVGCFLNGCCYGRPTRLPWGVVFPPDSFAGLEFGTTPVHPAQLYFALAGLALSLLAWVLRRALAPPGVLFWTIIGLFALVRIPLDFTRAYEIESRILEIGGLSITESQVTSLLIALFAGLMIVRLRRGASTPSAPRG
jgi:phosphatidylglycerol---prolipoprotein diacylglyceryl transferase